MGIESKRIGNLPQMEEMTEETNIVVEEGGRAKRIPAGKALPTGLPANPGAYQQLVTGADGVAKWEDRTHYSASVNLEWDGDESNPNYDAKANMMFISDAITSLEQLDGLHFVISKILPTANTYDLLPDDEGSDSVTYRKFDSEVAVIDASNGRCIFPGCYEVRVEAGIAELEEWAYTVICVVASDSTAPDGSTVKAGLYLVKGPGYDVSFVSKLYGESIKPIPAEYLPAVPHFYLKDKNIYFDYNCIDGVTMEMLRNISPFGATVGDPDGNEKSGVVSVDYKSGYVYFVKDEGIKTAYAVDRPLS